MFAETILEELPREIAKMSPEQVELEKPERNQRNRMELEKARIEQERRLREIDLTGSRCGGNYGGNQGSLE